jgi:hypothetical protein
MKIRILTMFGIALVMYAGVLMAADIQETPVLFYHEDAEVPQLTLLQKEHDFALYVSAGKNEMEEMALLKNWVYGSIPYGLNYDDSELRDSLKILRRARKGDAFLCTTMATVYLQCAVSMGWTARIIFLKRPTGEEHAGNDVWSNRFRKWVYIDPTWNIHLERRGVPLGIFEIRREWLKNRGRDIVYVFGAGKNERRYRARDLPVVRDDSKIWKLIPLDRVWLSYTGEIAVLGRNDFFSSGARDGTAPSDPVYVLGRKTNWKERFKSFLGVGKKSAPVNLFYDLNRVDISIERDKEKSDNYVIIRLDAFGKNNYTPNFMEYLVRINGREWEVMNDRFELKLKDRDNIVQARIMNRFGVAGPVTEKRISGPGMNDEAGIEKGYRQARRRYEYKDRTGMVTN